MSALARKQDRWLTWKPKARISEDSGRTEPTKPSIPQAIASDGAPTTDSPKIEGETIPARCVSVPAGSHQLPPATGVNADLESHPTLDSVLRDLVIELCSAENGRLFLVADDIAASRVLAQLGTRRGEIYIASEIRRINAMQDPALVAEVHKWKRRFDGTVRGEG